MRPNKMESVDRTDRVTPAELGGGLVLVLWFALFIQRGSFEVAGQSIYTLFDDAMISMRYAQNLAAGHGLTWNAGETPVEGFTNPLWTLWMALLHLVGIAPSTVALWVSVTSACTVLATAFTMRMLAHEIYPGSRATAVLAFWGTATYYPLVFWSLRGMEVGLVALLLSASVLLAVRLERRYTRTRLIFLTALLSLAVLTRMELLAPAGLIVLFASWRAAGHRWQVLLVLSAGLIGTIGISTGLRVVYYGEWLPNTYYLKLGGVAIGTRLARGSAFLIVMSLMHMGGLLVLAAAMLWRQRFRLAPAEGLLLGLYLGLCAYSAWVGGDAWDFYAFANRFVTPAVPFLMLVVLGGTARLAETASRRWFVVLGVFFLALTVVDGLLLRTEETGPALVRGLGALFTAVALLAAPVLIRRTHVRQAQCLLAGSLLVGINLGPLWGWLVYDAPHSLGDRAWAAYGLLLTETTAPDATVAVTWAGNATYFSQRNTFDQLGKTDAVIAHGPNVNPTFRPGHSKWNFQRTFGELKPDVIAALYYVTDADLASIEGWGYVRIVGNCYVRGDSQKVDVAGLRDGIVALNADRRFLGALCVRQDAESAFPATWFPDSRAEREAAARGFAQLRDDASRSSRPRRSGGS